jgi:excisionase family DNA binding protein
MHPDGTAFDGLAKALALEIAERLRPEIARLTAPSVQPALLTVKEAGIYLGRSEQAIQHLVFERQLPVVRVGRRVHLDRKDLDAFIEKNKDR